MFFYWANWRVLLSHYSSLSKTHNVVNNCTKFGQFMLVKIMTCIVSSGALNSTHSLTRQNNYNCCHQLWDLHQIRTNFAHEHLPCHPSSRCTKFDFGWGFAPDPTEVTCLQRSAKPPGLQGPTSKGNQRMKKREGKWGDGKGGCPFSVCRCPSRWLQMTTGFAPVWLWAVERGKGVLLPKGWSGSATDQEPFAQVAPCWMIGFRPVWCWLARNSLHCWGTCGWWCHWQLFRSSAPLQKPLLQNYEHADCWAFCAIQAVHFLYQ